MENNKAPRKGSTAHYWYMENQKALESLAAAQDKLQTDAIEIDRLRDELMQTINARDEFAAQVVEANLRASTAEGVARMRQAHADSLADQLHIAKGIIGQLTIDAEARNGD